jgi:hypothetical protein
MPDRSIWAAVELLGLWARYQVIDIHKAHEKSDKKPKPKKLR